eukprot:jgi/Picsp_1/4149/NSC_01658-R1_polar amino acid uptake family abc periplasmic substrate-binding protein
MGARINHLALSIVLLVSAGGLLQAAEAQYVPAVVRSNLYPFYNTTDPDPSKWTGFEIDLLNWMCNVSGLVLGDGVDNTPIVDCAPREDWFVAPVFAQLLEAVENGTADFAMSLVSRSAEREAVYDYVKPFYYSSGAGLYVLDRDSNLTFQGLRGKSLCAAEGYYLSVNTVLKDRFGIRDVVSVPSSRDAIPLLQNGTCAAIVAGDVGRLYGESLGLYIAGPSISQQPIGIITAKEAPKALKEDLSVGLVSAMWSGANSDILAFENETIVASGYPANKNLERLVTAITGLDTKNGFELDWAPTTPVFGGSEGLESNTSAFNVTLLMFSSSPLPLASIQGDASFLDENSEWIGMEVEIGKAICDSPYFNCENVLVTANITDRLSYLDQGLADISIGDISVTQDRLNNYSFVQPMYYSAGPGIYVSDSASVQEPQPGLEYADGKTLCTIEGSAYNEQAEAAGATLEYYGSQEEMVQGVLNGSCDGLLWDSNVSFEVDGLKQASADMSAAYPIGIAISPDSQYAVYTALSALMVDLLDNYPDSGMVLWSKEYAAGAYPNPQLYASSESVSNFLLSDGVETAGEPESAPEPESSLPPESSTADAPESSTPDSPVIPSPIADAPTTTSGGQVGSQADIALALAAGMLALFT